MSKGKLSSVLIVENENGHVFIVENSKSTKHNEKNFSIKTQDEKEKIEEEESEIKQLIKNEPLENCDEMNMNGSYEIHFIDTNEDCEEAHEFSPVKHEPKMYLSEKSKTFDGDWSDEYAANTNGTLEHQLKKSNRNYKQNSSKITEKTNNNKLGISVDKFSCKYCDTIFANRNELWMHICKYLLCKPDNFICRICNQEISKKAFNDHEHEQFFCHYCDKKFINPRNLKAHIINVHRSQCEISPRRTNIDDTVKNNSNILHLEKPSVINSLLRRKGVRTKIKYPRKKQRFECDLCGKYLVSLRSLQFHMNLHRGDSSYICPSCGLSYFTPNGVKGHSCEKKRRRPEKDFRTYDMRYCRFCDQHFTSLDENKAHKCEFQSPDDPKMVYCRSCGKILNKLAFNRHMETHSGVDWICSICNRKLATQRALRTHMTTHSGNKPYKCSECSETFINKVVLERHMRFHGKTQKLFRCEYCFKQLSTETSLKSHLQRLHKTTSQCELCKLEFPNRDYLKDHFQNAHPPSICRVCGKSFALPRYLKMHEKLHFSDDSVMKITCQICSKQLSVKNIKHHVYRHHVDQFDAWIQQNPHY